MTCRNSTGYWAERPEFSQTGPLPFALSEAEPSFAAPFFRRRRATAARILRRPQPTNSRVAYEDRWVDIVDGCIDGWIYIHL